MRGERRCGGRTAVVVLVMVLTGCSRVQPEAVSDPVVIEGTSPGRESWSPPPAGLGHDICCVNGFQTQPGDSAAFAAVHPELVLQTDDGPLADPDWPDEMLFDAVEVDDLDSWTRSQGRLTAADTPEEPARLRAAGYDFAVVEPCEVCFECGACTAQYPVVLDIEHTDGLGADRFAEPCADGSGSGGLQRVLRDHDLLTPDDDGYAYEPCPA